MKVAPPKQQNPNPVGQQINGKNLFFTKFTDMISQRYEFVQASTSVLQAAFAS